MVADDFIQSDVILGSKKIEAPVLFWGIAHSLNPINNLVLKVLSASPSAYSANPKTKSLNAQMMTGSTISLVSVVHAISNVRILISGSLSMFSDRFFRSEVQKAGSSTSHEKSSNEQFLVDYERLGYTSLSLSKHIPLRPLEMNSIPPPQNNIGWCIHAFINSSSLENYISCRQHRLDESAIVLSESYYCTWLEKYKYVCFHFGGAITLQIIKCVHNSVHQMEGTVLMALFQQYKGIVDFLQAVAPKKDQTQFSANPLTPYSLILVAEFVEAIR
ncbi:hypothetical protein Nepgr_012588 [Nepenthes gracilis]|uniref:Dolichyl-diphosphooligosaccharide--protein glycosyltransferase 48 kDa subunit n=1 Tax=Nepenthes gracilis TaxID=150966 RepID=A0AAD3SGD0_NEPGR|nr:hypothetical protein Nepgr_012588 [Nepenthes gracilis]